MFKDYRILFIHHGTGWGGAPKSLVLLIQALQKKGFRNIRVLTLDSEAVSKLRQCTEDVQIIDRLPYFVYQSYSCFWFLNFRFWKERWWAFKKRKDWYSLFRSIDCDLVYLNSVTLCDLIVPAIKTEKKVILVVRETVPKGALGLRKKYLLKKLNQATAVQFISEYDRLQYRLNVPIAKVVPNFIDFSVYNKSLFSINNLREENQIPQETSVILFLGGTLRIKGLLTLVKSIKYLSTEKNILISWRRLQRF